MTTIHILATPGVSGPSVFVDEIGKIKKIIRLCPGANLIYLRSLNKYLYPIEIIVNSILISFYLIYFSAKTHKKIVCIVHTSINLAGILGALLVRPLISRLILIVHESHYKYVKIARPLSWFCDETYTVYEPEISGQILFYNYINVVPLVVRKTGFNANLNRFGYAQIGNLSEVKNYELLINGAKCGIFKRGEVKVCGGILATQRKYGEYLIDSFNAVGIQYLGLKDWSELSLILSNSKYVLLTSFSEGLSTSIIEGLACGCIPIASNIKSNVSLFNKLGLPHELLFDLNNIDSLRFSIQYAESVQVSDVNGWGRLVENAFSSEEAVKVLNL